MRPYIALDMAKEAQATLERAMIGAAVMARSRFVYWRWWQRTDVFCLGDATRRIETVTA